MATTLTAINKKFEPVTWETPDCPLCGQTESRVLERFGHGHCYTYQACGGCGVAYQKPRPVYDDSFTETAYEVYSDGNHHYWKDSAFTAEGKTVSREYAHILKEIEFFTGKKGRILDIGCNTGFFLKSAADQSWYPVGVEISKSMVEIAKRDFGVEAHSGDWMQIEFHEGFDAIYCSHVIEHIPDPTSWMERFKKVLKPNGIICLSVPNNHSIDRKFKRLLKRIGLRKDKWEPWRTPDHLFEPCERSMRKFFDKTGFELLRTYTYPSQWLGNVSFSHRLMHLWLRWGAKQRYYLRPKA